MGIFDKFKKKENDGYESTRSKMGTEFVNLYIRQKGITFEMVSELERQILAVYFSGALLYNLNQRC